MISLTRLEAEETLQSSEARPFAPEGVHTRHDMMLRVAMLSAVSAEEIRIPPADMEWLVGGPTVRVPKGMSEILPNRRCRGFQFRGQDLVVTSELILRVQGLCVLCH